MGPASDPAERNIIGVIGKLGVDVGRKVITARKWGHEAAAIFGGRPVNPENAIPGGVSKPITAQERDRLEEIARYMVDFAKFTLAAPAGARQPAYVDLILNGPYRHRTYSMGLVDDKNRTNFYDGKVRVVDPDGQELCKYAPRDYAKHIAERVEPWSYLKFPYLTQVGWKGFVDGKQSGVYRATPQARLNVADAMSTPPAQEAFEEYFETLTGDRSGRTMVHHTLAIHWARVVEMVNAAERAAELVRHPELTHPENYRVIPRRHPHRGGRHRRGAARHARAPLRDRRGRHRAEGEPGGGHDQQPRGHLHVDQAGRAGVDPPRAEVTEGLLNMVEMAFRAYDPCFGCATHSLTGRMPMTVRVREADGTVVQEAPGSGLKAQGSRLRAASR